MNIKKSSRISKASNESAAMISKRILEAVEQAGIQEALNGKAYQAHTEISLQFAKAAEKLKRKELSKPVNKYYADRSLLFSVMYQYVKGLCNAPDAEMAEAAQQVFKSLNMYGQYLGNLKVEVQSFRYNRIIDALKQPELAAALTKIQLTAKVAELDDNQRAYENQFVERSNKIKSNVSATSLRKSLNEAIRLHIDELNWLARQTESEALRRLCFEVNARIGDLVLSQQRNSTTNETETTEQPAQSA